MKFSVRVASDHFNVHRRQDSSRRYDSGSSARFWVGKTVMQQGAFSSRDRGRWCWLRRIRKRAELRLRTWRYLRFSTIGV